MINIVQAVTITLTALTIATATVTAARLRIQKAAEKLLARSGTMTVLRKDLAQRQADH